MSNQVEDCFKFLWPFQNVRTLYKIENSLCTFFQAGDFGQNLRLQTQYIKWGIFSNFLNYCDGKKLILPDTKSGNTALGHLLFYFSQN